MNFFEHYFTEKKKRKKKKRSKKSRKYTPKASYFPYFGGYSDGGDSSDGGGDSGGGMGESLDTKANVQWEPPIFGKIFVGNFNVDDKEYAIQLINRNSELDDDIDVFEILFHPKGMEADAYELTNDSSNAIKVFGAVASILREWTQTKKPYAFYFTAKEPKRIRTYDRFMNLIEKESGYKFDEELNNLVSSELEDLESKFYTFSRR